MWWYNAGMGDSERGAAAEIDSWLRGGGLVVAASERAARVVALAFHRSRRAEGLTAWPAPDVRDWHGFARDAWRERNFDDRLLLDYLQETALWAEIAEASGQRSVLLPGPRQRVASLVMEAHGLLCLFALQYLEKRARVAWPQDAGEFSGWLERFDEACRAAGAVSAARLPLELESMLAADSVERPPLLLVGFDRILPAQRRVFDAWGEWREAPLDVVAEQVDFYEARDEQSELEACALWCSQRLAGDPQTRLLVVAQGVAQRRGEIERTFLRFGSGSAPQFEFSLGVPLGSAAVARSAMLVLRWLAGSLAEREIDWLFSCGHMAAGDAESQALGGFMRALRRRGMERTRWSFDDFARQRAGVELPLAWMARITQAKRVLAESARQPQAPLEWAELVSRLLEAAGWPGTRPLTSAEEQARRRLLETVESCSALGWNGRRMSWSGFLAELGRAIGETLFAPESRDASIQIAGPAESAGLTADAVWFLGAGEDAWPAAGAAHPCVPIGVQRAAAMPHATAQLDWDLAQKITARLLASAPEAHFSYAKQSAGARVRPSRLAVQFAGVPQPVPSELIAPAAPVAQTVEIEDWDCVPFAGDSVAGGSAVITAQSQCPFKAFAEFRLEAEGWEPAQAGLTATERGSLLHAVLHSIWRGKPEGIRSHGELVAIADLRGFVESRVRAVLRDEMPARAREQMPRRYLELEEARLIALVTEWLEYERGRLRFDVARTELDVNRQVEGLKLKLRLDRVDRLNDGSLLAIDYKSGNVSARSWELPRPDDTQLPLYVAFGLDEPLRTEIAAEFAAADGGKENDGLIGGLVFAKVSAGRMSFDGRVADAQAALHPGIGGRSSLAKKQLAAEDLIAWREYIEQMARDFLGGRADVDPREYPRTCERCGLQTLCRIHERPVETDDESGEEEGDE